ncbi:MAG TPA: DUF4325 domain-containing protein [Candidatus Acidoferrum sp.]|nr:DUF4325 domain-containing protein [Candidatus Acidoferrum sp.]
MNTSSKKILVRTSVAKDLVTRNAATEFFKKLKKIKSNTVVLDFTGVVFMSRSFADEYIAQKNSFKTDINEINMPDTVERTLDAVSHVRTTRIEVPRLRAEHLSI